MQPPPLILSSSKGLGFGAVMVRRPSTEGHYERLVTRIIDMKYWLSLVGRLALFFPAAVLAVGDQSDGFIGAHPAHRPGGVHGPQHHAAPAQ